MNDHDLYLTGMMNPDEQEQWDYVTQMIAEAGEYDGMVIDRNAEDSGDCEGDEGDGVPCPSGDIEF